MKKRRKSIELDDLLGDEVEQGSNDRDMIIVNSRTEQPKEKSKGNRISRLKSAETTEEGEVYGHDEPVYEDVDLGEIKIRGGEIHRKRHQEEKEALKENEEQMEPLLDQLTGQEPEDVTNMEADVRTAEEKIEREKIESAHKETVNKILEDLLI